MMTSTATVLHRDMVAGGRFTHKSGREMQRFVSPHDTERQHMVFIDAEADDEMGNPAEVTVTVEAGDTLDLDPVAQS